MLKEITGKQQPSSIDLSQTPFWVKTYDLSLNSRNKKTAILLGNKIRKFLMEDSDDSKWGRYLRFQSYTKPSPSFAKGDNGSVKEQSG